MNFFGGEITLQHPDRRGQELIDDAEENGTDEDDPKWNRHLDKTSSIFMDGVADSSVKLGAIVHPLYNFYNQCNGFIFLSRTDCLGPHDHIGGVHTWGP